MKSVHFLPFHKFNVLLFCYSVHNWYEKCKNFAIENDEKNIYCALFYRTYFILCMCMLYTYLYSAVCVLVFSMACEMNTRTHYVWWKKHSSHKNDFRFTLFGWILRNILPKMNFTKHGFFDYKVSCIVIAHFLTKLFSTFEIMSYNCCCCWPKSH